jgi:hypothetical protein
MDTEIKVMLVPILAIIILAIIAVTIVGVCVAVARKDDTGAFDLDDQNNHQWF